MAYRVSPIATVLRSRPKWAKPGEQRQRGDRVHGSGDAEKRTFKPPPAPRGQRERECDDQGRQKTGTIVRYRWSPSAVSQQVDMIGDVGPREPADSAARPVG